MKAGIAAAAALIASLGCGQALADGNELLKQCQAMIRFIDSDGKEGGGYGPGYCMGVITGVSSLRGITNPTFPREYQTCFPTPAPPNIQAARIAVKFMKAYPEKLNLDDGFLMLMALQQAFPCKK